MSPHDHSFSNFKPQIDRVNTTPCEPMQIEILVNDKIDLYKRPALGVSICFSRTTLPRGADHEDQQRMASHKQSARSRFAV